MGKRITTKQRVQLINGVSYVYEDYPYWDVEKKQTRHKREYIGKLDDNGQFVPNKTYSSRRKLEEATSSGALNAAPPAARSYYGATYLLDQIGERCGVIPDLKASFPEDYQKILSLAYYLILEKDSPIERFARWSGNHRHPLGGDFPAQSISALFASISEDAKQTFFQKQSQRRSEQDYLVYDTNSIDSYSELTAQVKQGKHQDRDWLPQVNLALVFGQESMLPVYYRKLPGNITTVKTIRNLLKDMADRNMKKVKLVLDQAFFSARNINALYRGHYKFLSPAQCDTGLASSLLERVRESVKDFSCYDGKEEIYRVSSTEKWPYEEYDAQGKVVAQGTRRIYCHVYYNGQRAEDEKKTFLTRLKAAEARLREGAMDDDQKTLCDQYFVCQSTPGGLSIGYNEAAIRNHLKNFGYAVLLSNVIKDSAQALALYRAKDRIEESCANLKDRLNMGRTSLGSGENLDGKLFVQFIALIFVSSLHQGMRENHLEKNYTLQTLLDELDIIERYDYPNQPCQFSEITPSQGKLYACFGVEPPNKG